MSEWTSEALERATRDGAVRILAEIQRAVDLALPLTWADWLANNVLTPLQDAAYLSAARWHTYVKGCRGRRP